MTITTKFKKDITTLRSAVEGDFFLDVRNPKLYKKVRKYYQSEGVEFSGDPLDVSKNKITIHKCIEICIF